MSELKKTFNSLITARPTSTNLKYQIDTENIIMSKRTILSFFEPSKKKIRAVESSDDPDLDPNCGAAVAADPDPQLLVKEECPNAENAPRDIQLAMDHLPWYITADIGSWRDLLAREFEKEYFNKLMVFIYHRSCIIS